MSFNWDKLLNSERRRRSVKHPEDERTEFERDYDRLIYSSSLRRLQDKTQVFPLERHDFIRTRLTHSLEVSTLGRAFGVDIVRTLHKKGIANLTQRESDIAAILSAVCLAHDIGNPPFGHFGETAIRTWFQKNLNTYPLDEAQQQDFLNFEGNAQGFRILTHLQHLDDEFGLNLTYGTLASYHKYTVPSIAVDPSGGKSKQKVGYYTSEKVVFDEVQDKTGLMGKRHPLVFLMEAADDITYSTVDLEDALKKRVLRFDTILDALREKIHTHASEIEKLIQKRQDLLRKGWSRHEADQITCTQLRIWAVGVMFRSCVATFVDNYESIMSGEFDDSLVEKSNARDLHAVLKSIAEENVYNNPAVAMLEVIGAKVIHGLLDCFVSTVTSPHWSNPTTLESKRFNLISASLRDLNRIHGRNLSDTYDQLQLVTDFVCGMTDAYAHSLYRQLEGYEL